MDCLELGRTVAHCLVLKLGPELSAPINFMASRPYFRYLKHQCPTESDKRDFAEGYRSRWTELCQK